jgi:hypothetical protein
VHSTKSSAVSATSRPLCNPSNKETELMTDSATASHLRTDLTIDQKPAPKTAAIRCTPSSPTRSACKPSNASCTPATTGSRSGHRRQNSCRSWLNVPPANGSAPFQRRWQSPPTASPPCCSCATTTRAVRRWPWGSSPILPTMLLWVVGRIRTRPRSQPRCGRGDGRTRDRHLRQIPQAVDR